MDATTTSFGYWVRRQRRARDLTQTELADCVGCSLATIKKIESDDRRPSRQIAQRLAVCLHIPEDQRDLFLAVAQRDQAVDTLPLATAAVPAPAALAIMLPPIVVASFVGREAELHAIEARLLHEGCRLLTVVGLGGVGKTRLALEAAARLAHAYADGVCFVPLADVERVPEAAKAILRQLGLAEVDSTGAATYLAAALAERRLLLVLDNVEQLLHEPATCKLLADLLATAAGVALLVTSRERLNLHAEWVLPLHGLPRDDPAITLFTDRARQGGYAGVLPTPAVATICQLVEGLPLAVELAAGWTPFMTPEQIAEHLQAGLPPLTTRLRDVPNRHRSLEAVFDHSWMLLAETEQAIWMRLAVFRGGFASEAAAAVAGADLPALVTLVDKSLLRADGRGRYDLHALARHYAAGRLAMANATDATRRRHADYFFALVRRAADERDERAADQWKAWVEAEYLNIQAAWQWALNGRRWGGLPPDSSGGYAVALLALSTLLFRTGRIAESLPYADAGYRHALTTEDPTTIAMAEMHQGLMVADASAREGHFLAALRACRQADNRALLANALLVYGDYLREQGALAAAHAQYTESLAHARALGNEEQVIYPLGNLGRLALLDGALDQAATRFAASVAIARAHGATIVLADWLLRLGIAQLYAGDTATAHATLLECVALVEDLNHWHKLPTTLLWLAVATLETGDAIAASELLQRSLVAYQGRLRSPASAHPGPAELIEALVAAASISTAQQHFAQAATRLGCAEALGDQTQSPIDPFLRVMADQVRKQLDDVLGSTELKQTLARGRSTSVVACLTPDP